MKTRFENKEDFVIFKNELRERLNKRGFRRIEPDKLKSSAVNVLFLNKDAELYVFLTKRSANLLHHRGQIAFPGGKFDPSDVNLLETAMRETFEETGISRDKIEHIGRFDDFITVSGFHVACFIGAIEYPYEYKLKEDETEECFEIPMRIFTNKEYSQIDSAAVADKVVSVYHYNYMDKDIWGLTARILTDLACKTIANADE